jgi:hypothetical protein
VKYIPLSGQRGAGKFAIVDDEDYERLNKFKWWLGANGYACGRVGGQRMVTLHSLLMPRKPGYTVDHKYGNKLDNRHSRLRYLTPAQNVLNVHRLRSTNTSGYRGVSWSKANRKWLAQIKHKYMWHYLGYFVTPSEAAQAYNIAAERLHGDFARLNVLK